MDKRPNIPETKIRQAIEDINVFYISYCLFTTLFSSEEFSHNNKKNDLIDNLSLPHQIADVPSLQIAKHAEND